jgi:hypothetical protein
MKRLNKCISSCEAEDELEEEGGLVGIRPARSVLRGIAERKQIAAQLMSVRPRDRIINRINSFPAVDILSTIMKEQEKLYKSPSVNKLPQDFG